MAVDTSHHHRRPTFSLGSPRWPYRVVAVEPTTGGAVVATSALTAMGIDFRSFPDGAAALLCMSAEDPAAVLAPTEMLGVDFAYFINTVAQFCDVPLIVGLTADPDSHQRACWALDRGARGLVALPAEPDQLSSLIQQFGAKLSAFASPIQHGLISLDAHAHRVGVGGVAVNLTPTEFTALGHLMESAPAIVSSNEFSEVLSIDHRMTANHVKRVISRLRYKLSTAAPGHPDFIDTVRSLGYRLRD